MRDNNVVEVTLFIVRFGGIKLFKYTIKSTSYNYYSGFKEQTQAESELAPIIWLQLEVGVEV